MACLQAAVTCHCMDRFGSTIPRSLTTAVGVSFLLDTVEILCIFFWALSPYCLCDERYKQCTSSDRNFSNAHVQISAEACERLGSAVSLRPASSLL